MATPPESSSNSTPQSPSTEPGPSRVAHSPSNKRCASVPLSDTETLVIKAPRAASRMKTTTANIDAYRRKRRRRRRLPITRNSVEISKEQCTHDPVSLKGKEREPSAESTHDGTHIATSVVRENSEVIQLQTKLDEQASLLNAHKEFLTALAPSLTCQICLDPMLKPYTLAPCGHTACYDCLLAWFRAPPAHINFPPPEHLAYNFDANNLLARDAPMLLGKEKTCPHCRAVVRDAPVEAWGIKDIINHVFAHKGHVAKELYPTYTSPQESNQNGSSQAGTDAWKGVFKRHKMLPVPNGHRNDDNVPNDFAAPFYDEEDGIYRCTDCYHEMVNGICTHCGRLYPAYHDEIGGEEVDDGNWMDAEGFDGFAVNDINLNDVVNEGPAGDIGFRDVMGALGFPRRVRDARLDDEGEEHEDEVYESSFIDDRDDDYAGMEEYHSVEEAGRYESEDEDIVRSEDRHHREDEDDVAPRSVLPPRVDESDEEDTPVRVAPSVEIFDSDSDEARMPINNQRSRHNRILTDTDDDHSSMFTPSPRSDPGSRRSRRPSPIVDDSDLESDEDRRSPISPIGRRWNSGRYADSLSDDESLLDDGSDHSSQHDSSRSSRGSISGMSHGDSESHSFSDEEDSVWSD